MHPPISGFRESHPPTHRYFHLIAPESGERQSPCRFSYQAGSRELWCPHSLQNEHVSRSSHCHFHRPLLAKEQNAKKDGYCQLFILCTAPLTLCKNPFMSSEPRGVEDKFAPRAQAHSLDHPSQLHAGEHVYCVKNCVTVDCSSLRLFGGKLAGTTRLWPPCAHTIIAWIRGPSPSCTLGSAQYSTPLSSYPYRVPWAVPPTTHPRTRPSHTHTQALAPNHPVIVKRATRHFPPYKFPLFSLSYKSPTKTRLPYKSRLSVHASIGEYLTF